MQIINVSDLTTQWNWLRDEFKHTNDTLPRANQPGNRNPYSPTKNANHRYPPVDGVRHTQHLVGKHRRETKRASTGDQPGE